jgi:UDP-N-acetylmuramyl pentapeptide phosphotransferase/UDP-N-acetylglucosamine-1-phosphate transferase
MFKIGLLSFVVSFAAVIAFILLCSKYLFFTDKIDKEHAIHTKVTPKCGGIGIFISFFVASYFYCRMGVDLAISSLPIFIFGVYEDSNGETPQSLRLLLMIISSLIGVYLLKSYVNDIGFLKLPKIIGVVFTIFCVVGISSAINFIDGLNGLATGVCLLSILFFSIAGYYLNDLIFFKLMLICFFAILGFFVLNYPFGKIFLGDGGAYFLGFLMAFISIILVNRHPEISPWYPLNAFAYPIIETLVTIKRRYYKKKNKGTPFFQSEKIHLHTLLFKRKTRRNPVASAYLLSFHFLINLTAFLLKSNFPALVLLFILTWFIYLQWYKSMFIKIIKINP